MEDLPRSRFLSRCPISQEIDRNEITNERSSTAAVVFCRLVFRTAMQQPRAKTITNSQCKQSLLAVIYRGFREREITAFRLFAQREYCGVSR